MPATLTVANAPSAGYPVGTKVPIYALKGANTITPQSGPPPGTAVEESTVSATGQLVYTGLTEGTFYLCAAEVGGVWRYLHVYPETTGQAGVVTATGFRVVEGPNAKMGGGTLAAGKVTIPNTSVLATSRIFLTRTGPESGSVLSVTAIVPGVSFTVEASIGTDAGTFNYEIKDGA